MDSVRLSWQAQSTPRADPAGKRGYSSDEDSMEASEDLGTYFGIQNSHHPLKKSRVSSPYHHHEQPPLCTTESTPLHQPKPESAKAGRARFLGNLVASEQPDWDNYSPKNYILDWVNSLDTQIRSRTSPPELQPASPKAEDRARRSASAPAEMPPRKPPAPTSGFDTQSITFSQGGPATVSGSGPRAIETREYREFILLQNGVTIETRRFAPQPENISQLILDNTRERRSPSPSTTEIQMDDNLHYLEEFASKFRVEDFFKESGGILYSPARSDVLQRDSRVFLRREAVPSNPQIGTNISTPAPDMVYGYNHTRAFTIEHIYQLGKIPGVGPANSEMLYFPFFVVEFKGHDGSMSAAVSQCMGGSALCVNLAEHLNSHIQRLRQAHPTCNLADIETAAYSLSVNGSEAKLYVTWKQEDGSFKMQKVSAHHIQEPDQYIELRKRVKNILDWGKDARLKQIHELLDYMQENQDQQYGPPVSAYML